MTLPQTPAEMLPFAAAALTILFGLVGLFMPRVLLRVLRLQTHPLHPEAVAEMRGTIGGFHLGIGVLALLLFDQPNVQMMLGAGWLFSGFGRLVAILSDAGATLYNWLFLILAVAIAAMPLAVAFGFVAG